MAVQAKITSNSKGTLKTIGSSNVPRLYSPSGMFFDSNAAIRSSFPYTLSLSSKEIVVCEARSIFEIEVTLDTSGQGISISGVGTSLEVSVSSLSGSVYIVRAENLTAADTKSDAYAGSSKISASTGDILYNGDMIIGAAGAKFKLKYDGNFNQTSVMPFIAIFQLLESLY